MRRMEFDEPFPADYQCELLEELPNGTRRQCYFPGGTELGGRGGLMVSVQPHEGEEWLGIFAVGVLSRRGANAVLSMPHPRQLCVVSRGQGYIVEVTSAREIEVISMEPILGVMPAPAGGLLLMHDFSRVRAYGRNGRAWTTPAISWDGIQLREVTERAVHGTAWDAPNKKHVPFVIDLATGAQEGGASPELP
jgi:hypothetical protein